MRILRLAITAALLTTGLNAQVIPAVTAECATSVDGSVVGVPNPLQPPQTAVVYSGTLPAGNYFVQTAWYDAADHTTLPGPEVQVQLTGTGELQVSPPSSGMPANAAGTQVFIGTTSGSETYQGQAAGSATYIQSIPLVAGTALPTVNNTICQIIANDAGWPTGTGYQVSVSTPAGQTLPGFPMQWQLDGPGGTINLSQGLPLYNGSVQYPVPILSQPYGHAMQSISGPLSLGLYTFLAGKIGVNTAVPGWGLDVEGSGNAGAINSQAGYLFNGAGALNHVLLGNGSYYVDSATIPFSIISGLTLYYQTVAINGITSTQRPTLNFSSSFIEDDSIGPTLTTIELANSGVTAGTYTNPTSVSVSTTGQVTNITGGSNTGVDYYFTLTSCTVSAGAGGQCQGTATFTSGGNTSPSFPAMIDATYITNCDADFGTATSDTAIAFNVSGRTTSSFGYSLGNATNALGSGANSTLMCHLHHN